MKRPLYYLLCAITCTSMVGATMPIAAIAEAVQPQETAEQQAQVDAATSSNTGRAKDGSNTNATADTVEDGTETSIGASAVNTESAGGTPTVNATDTAAPGTTTATTTPTPSLQAQTTPTPAATSATPQPAYTHSATATQNGVTFTVSWNDAPAGTATTFHVTQTGGSSQAKARMDVPTYWDGGGQESVCDPSRPAWSGYYSLGAAGHDFTFDFTASGTYRIYFYFMDNDRNDPQNDKGIYYLRATAEVTVDDVARPSVTQIVNDAVTLCRQQTDGSEYDIALWLHDWTLDQLEYDHSLNWCSAESGLTRHQGTCESYQRIYSKLLNAAGIANGRITGNGHTWNAVKIDGKWCQMDLTWDDTSDNWYGDLDQRHLYFGLTDELMAIAHSDHTANYQKDDYVYRSTDLSNNYFVRNGKADEWAEKYADRIQQHLDAKEESFSIDADNQSFPPSISGIQNGIVAFAMNLREWIVQGTKVELTAASNVTKESNYKWSTEFEIQSKYDNSCTEAVLPDGKYCITSVLDPVKKLSADAYSSTLTQEVVVFSFSYVKDYDSYRITKGSKRLGSRDTQPMLLEPSDSKDQLWRLEKSGANWTIRNLESNKVIDDKWMQTSEGSTVWLYDYNNSPAQAWSLIPVDKSSDRSISDGNYRLSSPLSMGRGIGISEGSFVLSSSPVELKIEYKNDSNLYAISTGNNYLASVDKKIAQTSSCSNLNALWAISKSNDVYTLTNAATGTVVDDKWLDTKEGAEIWLYESNGSIAQQWIAIDCSSFEQPIPNGRYIIGSTLKNDMYIKCSAVGTLLSSRPDELDLSFDMTSGAYHITFEGKYLTSNNGFALLSKKNDAANQLWKLTKTEGYWTISNISDRCCLDDKWLDTSEGSTVWLYEPNGSSAQAWRISQGKSEARGSN